MKDAAPEPAAGHSPGGGSSGPPCRIAVFASGGGTNLQALVDHFQADADRGAGIALVVSDREGVGALDRAARAGVATRVIPAGGRAPADVAGDILAALDEAGIDLIALAGYLRLVPADVVRRYRHRMVNIHPALLPAFGGKGMYGRRIHEAVLEAGCRVTGVSAHLVDEQYDTGPILFQWPVPVAAGDTPDTLARRVLRVEHRVYPVVVEALARAVAEGRRGEPAAPDPPAAFRLHETAAPTEAELRRLLGLPG